MQTSLASGDQMKQALKPGQSQPGAGCMLKVAVSEQLILKLLADGVITASDINCLDQASKCCLRRLCKRSCADCIYRDSGSL